MYQHLLSTARHPWTPAWTAPAPGQWRGCSHRRHRHLRSQWRRCGGAGSAWRGRAPALTPTPCPRPPTPALLGGTARAHLGGGGGGDGGGRSGLHCGIVEPHARPPPGQPPPPHRAALRLPRPPRCGRMAARAGRTRSRSLTVSAGLAVRGRHAREESIPGAEGGPR